MREQREVKREEGEWRRGQLSKETKLQPRWWQGKIYVFLSCSFLPSHWQLCGRSLREGGKLHLTAGTCVSLMFRYDHLFVGWEGQTGGIRRCRGYLNQTIWEGRCERGHRSTKDLISFLLCWMGLGLCSLHLHEPFIEEQPQLAHECWL